MNFFKKKKPVKDYPATVMLDDGSTLKQTYKAVDHYDLMNQLKSDLMNRHYFTKSKSGFLMIKKMKGFKVDKK